MIRLLLCAVIFSCLIGAKAQTTSSINSGNPQFPFPQFLPYSHEDGTKLGNLADHNPEGVPHAELEQRVRDGWQLMCNNIYPVTNAKIGGVQYLRSKANLDCNCAEAYGYYLLAAAYMGDKNVYDGLYMYYHDNSFNGVTRFIDGVQNPYPGYSRGLSYAGSFGAGAIENPRGGAITGNSATDGDHDIALATLVAYKQWGEKSGIVVNGKEINYKDEALNYIRAMVDTGLYAPSLPEKKYYSGVVGLDGYIKNGDTGNELTTFAQNSYKGMKPERTGGDAALFDYYAPAYYRQFGDWLTTLNENPFLINQYKRGEASSDWLMGQLYGQGEQKIPFVGKVNLSPTNVPTFSPYSDGEDFRAPWRTILSYVWHGNPKNSWDPATHEIIPGVTNTYERDMGKRAATFVKNPQAAPWLNACNTFGTIPLTFNGPATLGYRYDADGKVTAEFTLNWAQGTLSPSAVASQDFDLMGKMFRQCVLEWDADDTGYVTSHPKYFHEWFRMLGMLVLTGNNHAPLQMNASANLKVYHSIDKTVAFNNDVIKFTVDYRNYGIVAATGSKISFEVPSDFTFVSSTKPSKLIGTKLTSEIGDVPGFKTGGLNATKGSITYTFKLSSNSSGRYAIAPKIECTNGTGWTSNEYPNHVTSVMERNSVDVIKRALKISKTANYPVFNPGDTLTYTINFSNSSDAGWINGGRPGVNFSFAHDVIADPTSDFNNTLKFRIFHDASEPYIDYGNYRFSYFINEPSMKCFAGDSGCNVGWGVMNTIYEGGDKKGVKFLRESIVPGKDSNGAWNQRIAIKFAPQLATTSQHLLNYSGLKNRIKEGGSSLLRGVWRLHTSTYSKIAWNDDWSWDAAANDKDGGLYYPVTPDVTNPLIAPIAVNKWHKSVCETSAKSVDKILVEEWDGYVWRRIFGNGPLPGRDINNVVISDTLPAGLVFAGFKGTNPFGIAPSYNQEKNIVTWSIPRLMINQKGKIIYQVKAGMPDGADCPTADQKIASASWISGNAESAFAGRDTITISCKKVTICTSSESFKIKTDKDSYTPEDTAIGYTIDYTQLEGSIGSSTLNSASDWTIQSGQGVAISGGNLVASGNSNFLATHNFSHGKNTLEEGIRGRFEVATYAKIGLALRYDVPAKTGVYLVFRADAMDTKIEVYNNDKLLNSGTIPITQKVFDFQIQLKNSQLDLWLGDAPFEGPPFYSVSGILEQAGYAGVIHGTAIGQNSGIHKLSFWKAHLDSGFDLEVNNPLPIGIAGISSISNNGQFIGNNITWKLSSAGVPVLYGAKFNVSWRGKIKDCKNGLNDNAYATMLGQPINFVQTCVLASCSTTTPVVEGPIVVSLSGQNTVQSTVLLTWTTTSLANTAYFEILRSIGGNTWLYLKRVELVGNSLTYNYEDKRPLTGVSYYQVNQVFNDSTTISSPLITIGFIKNLSFTLDKNNHQPLLTWYSSEVNTIHYDVMRSRDGIIWESINRTLPLGSGTSYTHIDSKPYGVRTYYSIRQVLKNGITYTSPVLFYDDPTAIINGSDKGLIVYPNPVLNQLFVNWQSTDSNYEIQLYNVAGTLVYSQTGLSGGLLQAIPIQSDLASGVYIVKLINKDQIVHKQIVKSK